MLINDDPKNHVGIDHKVEGLIAGAAPPAAIIEGAEKIGIAITHVYGLTRACKLQNVGTTGTQANFVNTVFNDSATTPIANGGPPFTGPFMPMQALSVLNNTSSYSGEAGTGTGVYTLEVTNAATGKTTTIGAWTLTLLESTPITGLGEPVADQATAGFRIFTMDPTNPLSSTTWTAVGPGLASAATQRRARSAPSRSTRPTPRATRSTSAGPPAASGRRPTSSPPRRRPDLDPADRLRPDLRHQHRLHRRLRPEQRPEPVDHRSPAPATATRPTARRQDHGTGRRLPDLDERRRDLVAARQHQQHPPVRRARPPLRRAAAPTYEDRGRPQPDAHRQVIFYAAMSGANGGLWRSIDTGQTWRRSSAHRTAKLPGNCDRRRRSTRRAPRSTP